MNFPSGRQCPRNLFYPSHYLTQTRGLAQICGTKDCVRVHTEKATVNVILRGKNSFRTQQSNFETGFHCHWHFLVSSFLFINRHETLCSSAIPCWEKAAGVSGVVVHMHLPNGSPRVFRRCPFLFSFWRKGGFLNSSEEAGYSNSPLVANDTPVIMENQMGPS